MKQIKIAHEAPKSIFKSVELATDYDYALVHLFEEDPKYYQLFVEARAKGREIILDNSIFELGTAFNPDRFLDWIIRLKPTWYIVPDVLENAQGTVDNMQNWINSFKAKVPEECKMIGVVQGKTYEDLVTCYRYMDRVANVDKIAISFDYSYYEKTFPHPNKLISWAFGRAKLLGDLMKDEILNPDKPHHLLGCGTPGEGLLYSSPEFDFIDSVDTSNPVVHGYLGITYEGAFGLTTKDSTKLYTLMNEEIDLEQWRNIHFNVTEFRKLWGGNYGL